MKLSIRMTTQGYIARRQLLPVEVEKKTGSGKNRENKAGYTAQDAPSTRL